MKSIIIPVLVALLAFGCKSQKSTETATSEERVSEQRNRQGNRKGKPSIDEVFKMDANNDGKLSESEVDGRLKKHFSTIDVNNDGFITRTEFENAPKPEKGQGRQPR